MPNITPNSELTNYINTWRELPPNYERNTEADKRFIVSGQTLVMPAIESEFERQKRAFEFIPEERLAQYNGQFVASHNGVILESDNNLRSLTLRLVERHGYIPVYITKVGGSLRINIPTRLTR